MPRLDYMATPAAAAAALGGTVRSLRIDSAVTVTAAQIAQASEIAGRLEALATRLMGSVDLNKQEVGSASPPPVRPSLSELEHQQETLTTQLSRIVRSVSRLEDL